MTTEIYKKIIWQHYHNPRNKGVLKNATEFDGKNPFCGDAVTFYLQLDAQKKIKEVKWEGEGCAISQAAASLFSEMILGKTLSQAQKINKEKFLEKLEEPLSPSRVKCALLPLYTVKEEEID